MNFKGPFSVLILIGLSEHLLVSINSSTLKRFLLAAKKHPLLIRCAPASGSLLRLCSHILLLSLHLSAPDTLASFLFLPCQVHFSFLPHGSLPRCLHGSHPALPSGIGSSVTGAIYIFPCTFSPQHLWSSASLSVLLIYFIYCWSLLLGNRFHAGGDFHLCVPCCIPSA